jgi:hypothetical protein
MLVSFLACSSTLKMDANVAPKRRLTFQRTTRRYIPDDRTLHNRRWLEGAKDANLCLLVFWKRAKVLWKQNNLVHSTCNVVRGVYEQAFAWPFGHGSEPLGFHRRRRSPDDRRSQWPRGVFARSKTGIVGSNPTRGMDVCVRLFCV